MVRVPLPNRLKSFHSTPSIHSSPPSDPPSRTGSPKPPFTMHMPSDSKGPPLLLRVNIVKGRDLAAKDKNGTSDPYLVLTLGDARQSTITIPKTLNPEWNESIDLPVVSSSTTLLEIVCWDKDRFKKDYMGEFDVSLDELFGQGVLSHEPKWWPLQSRKTGRKKSVVTGEILIGFTLLDGTGKAASPQSLQQKLAAISIATPGLEDDYHTPILGRTPSDGLEGDDDTDEVSSDESTGEAETDDQSKTDVSEKRNRKRRLKRIKKRVKQQAYAFRQTSDLDGILFLEIQRITDLPPERNMTKTSFDMDPFVVSSLGKKTYRTKVIRHNLNPVYDEKLVFQVHRHETKYTLNFTVIDRDKLSGNDFIGTAEFPLENATAAAPDADPETGLYPLRAPESQMTPEIKKSRFRMALSRTSSSTSVNKLQVRPKLTEQSSTLSTNGSSGLDSSLPSSTAASTLLPPTAPTSAPTSNAPSTAAGITDPSSLASLNIQDSTQDDPDIKSYILPLSLKKKEKWEDKHHPTLYIRAKYMPYRALRQQFWRAMLKVYDADDSCSLNKVELTTMLDMLGSTLHESTIDGFFKRFNGDQDHSIESTLTFDQAVMCLEDWLQSVEQRKSHFRRGITGASTNDSGLSSNNQSTENINQSVRGLGIGTTSSSSSGTHTPVHVDSQNSDLQVIDNSVRGPLGEEGELIDANDLADERGEERMVEIRECPICHQPRLTKKSDVDIITHIATCASQDWRQVNNFVMAGFVTSSQAQRKWYSKVITKISYGGYKLGANSANILVQDRITGQVNEERMSVYVRLGIRLLYKGLKSRDMETKRIRKLLKSMSYKQGRKFDDPASAADIQGFINFHQLDMSEVLLPTEQFKNFNEFFYRQLKPDARPCSAPDRPQIITSPADCRTVVFNKIDDAQKIWVKGREFSLARLFGSAYPDDAKRYIGGALGIFRLAPQDYHRFHIPVDGTLGEPRLIEGEYYTVNPMAIRSALDVYGENVRVVVPIDSVAHGRVMVICVGAMMVGSTVITRKTGEEVKRAEELGYFQFGGSTILVLFEPHKMVFDSDLAANSATALETLVRVGMSIGHSPDTAPHTPDILDKNAGPVSSADKADAKRRIGGSLGADGDNTTDGEQDSKVKAKAPLASVLQ